MSFYSLFRFVVLQNVESSNSTLIPGRLLQWNEDNLFIEIGGNGVSIEKFDIAPGNMGRLYNGDDVDMWCLDELGDTFYDDADKARKSVGDDEWATLNKYKVKAVSEEEYRVILEEWNVMVKRRREVEVGELETLMSLESLMSGPDAEPGAWDDLKA